MTTVRFSVTTNLPPSTVIRALTDFGEQRPDRYRNIDRAHFRVHEQGLDWAEVTEGNVLAWERSRYRWDEARGLVTVETLESDSWGPGSGWDYQVNPRTPVGSEINVTVRRVPKTVRGRFIALSLPLVGRRILQRDFEAVLRCSQ